MSDADCPALFACMVFAAFFVLSVVGLLEKFGVIKHRDNDW